MISYMPHGNVIMIHFIVGLIKRYFYINPNLVEGVILPAVRFPLITEKR